MAVGGYGVFLDERIDYFSPGRIDDVTKDTTVEGIYVASRASLPERSEMWRMHRAAGVPIISSWIDEAGEGETSSFGELWLRIQGEIERSHGLVLYVLQGDFPLKGALIEVGMALAFGKPVVLVTDAAIEGRTYRPIGSWLAHPLVRRAKTVRDAFAVLDVLPPSFDARSHLPDNAVSK